MLSSPLHKTWANLSRQALAIKDLQSGKLVHLLEDYEDDTDGGIYAVFPSDRYSLPKVRVFVEFLIQSFP